VGRRLPAAAAASTAAAAASFLLRLKVLYTAPFWCTKRAMQLRTDSGRGPGSPGSQALLVQYISAGLQELSLSANGDAVGCLEALQQFAPLRLRKLWLLGSPDWEALGIAESRDQRLLQ
jgi:hypothetical protein